MLDEIHEINDSFDINDCFTDSQKKSETRVEAVIRKKIAKEKNEKIIEKRNVEKRNVAKSMVSEESISIVEKSLSDKIVKEKCIEKLVEKSKVSEGSIGIVEKSLIDKINKEKIVGNIIEEINVEVSEQNILEKSKIGNIVEKINVDVSEENIVENSIVKEKCVEKIVEKSCFEKMVEDEMLANKADACKENGTQDPDETMLEFDSGGELNQSFRDSTSEIEQCGQNVEDESFSPGSLHGLSDSIDKMSKPEKTTSESDNSDANKENIKKNTKIGECSKHKLNSSKKQIKKKYKHKIKEIFGEISSDVESTSGIEEKTKIIPKKMSKAANAKIAKQRLGQSNDDYYLNQINTHKV